MFCFCCILLTVFWVVVIMCTAHFNVKCPVSISRSQFSPVCQVYVFFRRNNDCSFNCYVPYVCNGYSIVHCGVQLRFKSIG